MSSNNELKVGSWVRDGNYRSGVINQFSRDRSIAYVAWSRHYTEGVPVEHLVEIPKPEPKGGEVATS